MMAKKKIIINGSLDVLHEKVCIRDAKNAMASLRNTSPNDLNDEGKILRRKIVELIQFKYDSTKDNEPARGTYRWFETTLRDFYYNNKDKFQNDIIYDILVNSMNRISGKRNSPIGKRLVFFYYAIAQNDSSLARLVSANLHGPAWRYIMKGTKAMDERLGSPIIARINDAAAGVLEKYYREVLSKENKVGISVSIYASKVASVVVPNHRYGHIIGVHSQTTIFH